MDAVCPPHSVSLSQHVLGLLWRHPGWHTLPLILNSPAPELGWDPALFLPCITQLFYTGLLVSWFLSLPISHLLSLMAWFSLDPSRYFRLCSPLYLQQTFSSAHTQEQPNPQFSFVFHLSFVTLMYHFCHFVDLPRAAVRILSNMTFLFVSLSYTAESAIVTAFITFIPKFIESQFGIPASNASIYTGKALPLGLLVSMAVVSLGHGGSGDGLACAASSCCPLRSL